MRILIHCLHESLLPIVFQNASKQDCETEAYLVHLGE